MICTIYIRNQRRRAKIILKRCGLLLQILQFQSTHSLIFYNYFHMKNIIHVLALAYLTTSVIIIQSEVGDVIMPTPTSSSRLAVQNTYPYNLTISQAPSAVWIWDKDWNNSNTPNSITIKKQFYASCLAPMTVYATADDNFTIIIGGNILLSGNDWRKVQSTTFTPKRENNTFIITAYNIGVGSQSNPAGLIYSIIQNDSSCYDCPARQSWSRITSSCKCIVYPCRSNQNWVDLPSCQCVCVKKKQCDQTHYWEEISCSCKCRPKICRSGYFQSMRTCQCISKFIKFDPNQLDGVDTLNVQDAADVLVEKNVAVEDIKSD